MAESLGTRLRQRREDRQIPLATIAEQTKIKLSLLEDLERDDVTHWPAGIFRRAFIRSYACAIGLDPEVVVREFVAVYPDPGDALNGPELNGNGDGAMTPGPPPTRLRSLVGSAMGSLARLRGGAIDPPRPRANDAIMTRAPWTRVAPAPTVPEVPTAELTVPEARGADPAAPHMEAVELDVVDMRAPEIPAPDATDGQMIAADTTALGISGFETAEPDVNALEISAAELTAPQPAGSESDRSEATPPQHRTPEPDIQAAAKICLELGQTFELEHAATLLEEAAALLGAVGLIVWLWDPASDSLRPALAHGYSPRAVAQLPRVDRNADNATAAGFRLAQTCVVHGSVAMSGALVIPLLTAFGCAGVLAIELPHGGESRDSVRALATIFAAQLARVVRVPRPSNALERRRA
jgi:hypothetical protein